MFIEKRLQSTLDTLTKLQEDFATLQQETGVFSVSDQLQLMVNTAGDIKAEQLAMDIQAEVLQNTFGQSHPMTAQYRNISSELGKKFDALIAGTENELIPGLDALPSISRKYTELHRQMRINAQLLEFIYPQYESARIQEQKQSANVQVLDEARVPNRKSKPPRRMIVMVSAIMSVIFTTAVIFIFEYWNKLPKSNPEEWQKIQQFFRRKGN